MAKLLVISLLCSALWMKQCFCQKTLLQSMINRKGCHMGFYVCWRRRERELTNGDTEKENVWGAEHLKRGRWRQYKDQQICINT